MTYVYLSIKKSPKIVKKIFLRTLVRFNHIMIIHKVTHFYKKNLKKMCYTKKNITGLIDYIDYVID